MHSFVVDHSHPEHLAEVARLVRDACVHGKRKDGKIPNNTDYTAIFYHLFREQYVCEIYRHSDGRILGACIVEDTDR